MASELGQRLSEARNYTGLSQAFVADAIGIPRSALSDIEHNRRKVSTDELQQLATIYGTSVEELLTGESDSDSDDGLRALARTARSLSDDDRDEVLHFAQFLRNRAQSKNRD